MTIGLAIALVGLVVAIGIRIFSKDPDPGLGFGGLIALVGAVVAVVGVLARCVGYLIAALATRAWPVAVFLFAALALALISFPVQAAMSSEWGRHMVREFAARRNPKWEEPVLYAVQIGVAMLGAANWCVGTLALRKLALQDKLQQSERRLLLLAFVAFLLGLWDLFRIGLTIHLESAPRNTGFEEQQSAASLGPLLLLGVIAVYLLGFLLMQYGLVKATWSLREDLRSVGSRA
jgi:hypothetical protein